ncbi:MAG TPA: GTP cyclohydrolase I FolE [Capsulimonadaceae bacterium]
MSQKTNGVADAGLSSSLLEATHFDLGTRNTEEQYRDILAAVGEDPTREGLLRTPHRASEAMKFLTQGYNMNVTELLNNAVFEETYDDMVVVRDIEFYSLCEHHLLPFFGKVHVGYVPNGKIVGLSKIPRLVDMYARRLQVQERLTKEIAEALENALHPKGVAVVVEGMHMCMMMRGVQKQNASMITSHVMGEFRDDRRTRSEFMALVKDNGRHS